MVNQITGADAVTLALVAPLALAAAVLALRRHPAAPVLALAPALFAVYTFAQLVLGAEHELPGNAERFFPLHLLVFVAGGAVAVAAWSAIDAGRLPAVGRRRRRALATLLLAVSAFLVVGLHLPGLVDALGPEPTRVEYLENPTVFWVVKLMDLGIVVPAAVATAVGLLRGARWARKTTYAVVGGLALVGASVAAMAIVMYANDDPDASLVFVVVFTAFALAFLALAGSLLRPLLGRAAREESAR